MIKKYLLVVILIASLLASCDARASCSMQAVAGGANTCATPAVSQ